MVRSGGKNSGPDVWSTRRGKCLYGYNPRGSRIRAIPEGQKTIVKPGPRVIKNAHFPNGAKFAPPGIWSGTRRTLGSSWSGSHLVNCEIEFFRYPPSYEKRA